MLDDLRTIQATITRALQRFLDRNVGNQNARAMVITSLNARLAAIQPWLTGGWNNLETLTMMEFIAAWDHAEEQIKKLKPDHDPHRYLNDEQQVWFPIPTLEIPRRHV